MALGTPNYNDVVQTFETKYVIKVESIDLRGSGRVSRTMIEEQVAADKYLQKMAPVPNAANLRKAVTTTDYAVPAYIHMFGVVVSTQIRAAEEGVWIV